MHRTRLASALALGLGAGAAHAVNVSPNGIGQALIYPYYTVQAGQQTLLSVVNTSDAGKALKVRFLEGYNGREVLEFTLFLAAKDIWTASVFKLSDAGLPGSGAAIASADKSCTAPKLPEGPLPNGVNYQHFLPYDYLGANSDTGPTSDARNNEGHFEVIEMADIVAGSALDGDIQYNFGNPNCAKAEADFETGDGTVTPTTGLFGAADVVDVAQGTFYAYNAVALDAFTAVKLNSPLASGSPNLSSANDAGGASVTARAFIAGNLVSSVYPTARAIDAVSALFAADAVYNEFALAADGSVATDWVLTFPTKRFYVDAEQLQTPIAPFDHLFGAHETGNGSGLSCTIVGFTLMDRNGLSNGLQGCGFPECPPGPPPSSVCLETTVLEFGPGALGSQLGQGVSQPFAAGLLQLDLDRSDTPHALGAASNGNVLHGLPVVGFAAIKYVNGAVPLTGGGSALANYTAAYPHRPTARCTTSSANVPCS